MGKVSSPAQKAAAAARWAAECQRANSPAPSTQQRGDASEEVADLQHLIDAMRRSACTQKEKHAAQMREAEAKMREAEAKARQLERQLRESGRAAEAADRRAEGECERLRRAAEAAAQSASEEVGRLKDELEYANNALTQAASSPDGVVASHSATDSYVSKLEWMLERASAQLDEREAELEQAQHHLEEADADLQNQQRKLEGPLKKKLAAEARQKAELERRLKAAQQAVEEERRKAALGSAVAEKRAATQDRVVKERGLAIVELQVRVGEAEQCAEAARCMLDDERHALGDERRALDNERREQAIMRRELSSLRSREQHLCAALSDRRERTAAVLDGLATLPTEFEAVAPRQQRAWLHSKVQSLRVGLDDSAEPLEPITEEQAAENLLKHASAQAGSVGELAASRPQAAVVGRAFSLEESRRSDRGRAAASPSRHPGAPSEALGEPEQATEVDGEGGWVTGSDSDRDVDADSLVSSDDEASAATDAAGVRGGGGGGSASETELQAWAERLVAESFQEFQADTAAAGSSPLPSADLSPATAAIAAFRQRVVDDSAAADNRAASWRDTDGSGTELSWAADDSTSCDETMDDERDRAASSQEHQAFPARRQQLSSTASPPSASLQEWRRQRSTAVAWDNVAFAHEQLQHALSPPPPLSAAGSGGGSGAADSTTTHSDGGDEVVGQGDTLCSDLTPGSPPKPQSLASPAPSPAAAVADNRRATAAAIRFSSPLESREKFRTPSPATTKGQKLLWQAAVTETETVQETDVETAAVECAPREAAFIVRDKEDENVFSQGAEEEEEGSGDDEDSEGWVTDESDDGSSADDEREQPPRQPLQETTTKWEEQPAPVEEGGGGGRKPLRAWREMDVKDRWASIRREAGAPAAVTTSPRSSNRRSAEAAGAAAAGSTKWSVLDGFLRRREQQALHHHATGEPAEPAQSSGSNVDPGGADVTVPNSDDDGSDVQRHETSSFLTRLTHHGPGRTVSHASPQERRGRGPLPRARGAELEAEPEASEEIIEPAKHDGDSSIVSFLDDDDTFGAQLVEPARHTASDCAAAPPAAAPTDAQKQAASDAAIARQKWRSRALSPTTPVEGAADNDNGHDDAGLSGSSSAPWSDAVTPVDEPQAAAASAALKVAADGSRSGRRAEGGNDVTTSRSSAADGGSGSRRRVRGKRLTRVGAAGAGAVAGAGGAGGGGGGEAWRRQSARAQRSLF
jgi:hypothetical protein